MKILIIIGIVVYAIIAIAFYALERISDDFPDNGILALGSIFFSIIWPLSILSIILAWLFEVCVDAFDRLIIRIIKIIDNTKE